MINSDHFDGEFAISHSHMRESKYTVVQVLETSHAWPVNACLCELCCSSASGYLMQCLAL